MRITHVIFFVYDAEISARLIDYVAFLSPGGVFALPEILHFLFGNIHGFLPVSCLGFPVEFRLEFPISF